MSAALHELIVRRSLKQPVVTFGEQRGLKTARMTFEGRVFEGTGPDRIAAADSASRKALEAVASSVEIVKLLFELPPIVIVYDGNLASKLPKIASGSALYILVDSQQPRPIGGVAPLEQWHPMRRDAFEHLRSRGCVWLQLAELQGTLAWVSGRGLAIRPQFYLAPEFDGVLRELGFESSVGR